MSHIDIAEAKKQLVRISDHLDEPLLLIGGLAVNQYVPTRLSQDIDIICDHKKAVELVDALYPSKFWNQKDENQDDYRVSFHLKHKHYSNYPIIKIGPKILERGSYKYLDWGVLKEKSLPFSHQNKPLKNILVPTMEALCYSKFVSLLGRSKKNVEKLRQDLKDIRELTNSDDFKYGLLLNLIAKFDFEGELRCSYRERVDQLGGDAEGCNLDTIIELFSPRSKNSDEVGVEKKTFMQPMPTIVTSTSNIRLVAFDLDGTLLKGLRHSWTIVWNHLNAGNLIQKERKERFQKGELSYLEWCRSDGEDFKNNGLLKSHFDEIVASGPSALTKNIREALLELRRNGIRTAIISGGIDALLYAFMPDADQYFDEILINRFLFSEDGKFIKISATEYDWDDSKVGVVGKRRGLERICEKYDISTEDAAFVGDDLNDFEAMRIAGLKIFYCGDSREFRNDHFPPGVVFIPDNNLLKVVGRILSPPTGEQVE